jgi:hypothetical protein
MAFVSYVPHSVMVLLLISLTVIPSQGHATSLIGSAPRPDFSKATAPKDNVVRKYITDCRGKPVKDPNCDKITKEAIEILKEDVLTVGASADDAYFPILQTIFFKSDVLDLRLAAVDAIGMIGPMDKDFGRLARMANDPVPDIRKAVGGMLNQVKSPAVALFLHRAGAGLGTRSGQTPETPADAAKYSMPVAPNSTYLFYASAAQHGRLTYVDEKGPNSAAAFFKGKAKKGPMKLEEFNQLYKYQLRDEEEARKGIWKQTNDASSKQMKAAEKNMMSNPQAALEIIAKQQGDLISQTMTELNDSYPSEWFDSPNVIVLEERQIGHRSYPTRYVVLYLDKALRKASYRLSWMTAPDDAIKAEQVASLAREKEELARNKENEALKKRAEALEALTKKKDEQEKSKFKKGQADLEKELGF